MTVNQGPRWAAVTVPPHRLPGVAAAYPIVVVLALSGMVAAADVTALCAEVAGLLAGSRARLVVCDVAALDGTGLATVDALAMLTLTVGRLGYQIQFRGVPREVLDLLVLTGLNDVLPMAAGEAQPRQAAGEPRAGQCPGGPSADKPEGWVSG
jgi:anti-anti-sigma regulatory factor